MPAVARDLAGGGDALALASRALVVPEGLTDRLAAALVDEPPVSTRDGDIVRQGFDAHRDSLHSLARSGKQWIAELEATERARTGIPSLKVGYNKVFGFYLEITNAHKDRVPADYERRQTLTGAERYVTPALKARESEVLRREDKLRAREQELFVALRVEIAAHVPALQRLADLLARLDAEAALARGRRALRVDAAGDGRLGPARRRRRAASVVERLLPQGEFVANDVRLGHHAGRCPRGELVRCVASGRPVRASTFFTSIGGATVRIPLSILVFGVIWLRRPALRPLIGLVAVLVLAPALSDLFRVLVRRPRPTVGATALPGSYSFLRVTPLQPRVRSAISRISPCARRGGCRHTSRSRSSQQGSSSASPIAGWSWAFIGQRRPRGHGHRPRGCRGSGHLGRCRDLAKGGESRRSARWPLVAASLAVAVMGLTLVRSISDPLHAPSLVPLVTTTLSDTVVDPRRSHDSPCGAKHSRGDRWSRSVSSS